LKRGTIDLRSDTVTQPTPQMRKAMAKADVGDDVFGEDPTVNRLEAETAEILGKEAAIFVPTGTMANLASVLTWCDRRGSEMVCGDRSHVFLWEQGGAAQLGGVAYRALPNRDDGTLDLEGVRTAIRPPNNLHFPTTRLAAYENTQAQCGGRVLTAEYGDALHALCRASGVPLHLDGARLWNAAAALGVPPARLAAAADSVAVCFSKGLAAPAGSAIAGSAEFVARARRARKALGGGMRQSGVLAAAALEALKRMLPRVGDDHGTALKLAQGLAALGMDGGLVVRPETVETNVVLAEVAEALRASGVTAADVVDRLRRRGVLAVAVTPWTVRFVTHYQVTGPDVGRVVSAVKEVLLEAGVTRMVVAGLSAATPAAAAASAVPEVSVAADGASS
ncbi:unnamed protein product, partial [Phaeothamnion confervicola]